ncbi:NADH dehydrogenase subunit E [Phycicoccus duodecadis]|uniref:NADH dehydrogenase subunit E n=1 Tax=Phycicoccus duodecadis TaxID=173053 RepID=A0A2N3YHT9_9MICO|nr:NADH-quinone oxidoreductase subunit NuoE [Phycicoccus duodecadis]PKW26415.1 NADH dehydrogenase subunit E [Phycicoccus duodecadis]
MTGHFGLQSASGHLTVPGESKDPYPADVEATFRADAAQVIARYPEKRSALLPLLHLVQSVDGYVTGRGIELCAELLDLTTAEVSGVATFYTQYKRHPNGEYTVGVCTNTLCAVMGGDEIWEAVSEHLGIGHDETTPDGKVTLERVECNAACDYAPVVMANWEFFDNQTPESTKQLVDDLREGKDVRPTRGPSRVCTFKQVSRTLAGFSDGLADEGVGAGPASLLGLEIAKRKGWSAPQGAGSAHGSSTAGAAPGNTEVTPASDDAKAEKSEPGAERDASDETPGEKHDAGTSTDKPAKKAAARKTPARRAAGTKAGPSDDGPPVASTGDGVSGVARQEGSPADPVDIEPAQDADLEHPKDRAANVSAQSASVPVGHDASAASTLFDEPDGDETTDAKGDR